MIKKIFGKDYTPRWISLADAFSCLRGVLEKSCGEQALPESQMDDVRLPEKTDLPDAQEIYRLRKSRPEALALNEKCSVKIDEMLRARLADGTIRCQGRFKLTVRILNIIDDRDFRRDLEFVDHPQLESEYKSVDQQLWKKDSWVSYRDSAITVWEMDESRLHDDWRSLDQYFVNAECTADGIFTMSGLNYLELEFNWKEEWVDLQVRTDDFLSSIENYFRKHEEVINNERNNFDAQSILKITGKNRFFYSKILAKWIVEFQGNVFCLNLSGKSTVALTVKHMLENGSSDVEHAVGNCTWFILYNIGSKNPPPDPSEDFNLRQNEGFSQVGSTSAESIVGKETAKSLHKERLSLREKLNNYEITEEEYNCKNKIILETINSKGKSRVFVCNELKKPKDAIRKRIRSFKGKLPPNGNQFKDHLDSMIISQPEGCIYNSDDKWDTVG